MLAACGAVLVAAGLALPVPALLAVVGVFAALAAIVFAPELMLVVLIFAGPLEASDYGDLLPFDPTTAAAGALVLALAVAVIRERAAWPAKPLPRAAALPVGIAAMAMFAVLWSPDVPGGITKAATFATVSLLVFFAPLVLLTGRTEMWRFMAGLAAAGTAMALLATETGHPARPLALPGSPSEIDVGLLTGLGLLAVVAYLIPQTPGWARVFWAIPGAIMLLTLVGAGSRGALLGAAAGLVVAAVAWMVLRPTARPLVAAMALLALAAAPLVWSTAPDDARARYTSVFGGGDGLLQAADAAGGDRSQIMASAVQMFRDNPLGVGTAGYPSLTGYVWPHNIILELGAELGVVAIVLFICLVAAAVAALVQAGRRGRFSPEVAGAAALLALPLVLSMSSFDLNGNRALWMALGAALAVGAFHRSLLGHPASAKKGGVP